ncbi:MAG: rhodanese-like domain-containing protein [Flavobacteriales bacterium]|nr:rhodanese-like domain-containing protein [Flavobacteriales bacterium]
MQRTPIFLVALLVALVSFGSCTGQTGGGAIDATAFAKAGATPKAQLIDVRTAAEFREGHLQGARNLDWTNGDLERALNILDKQAPVLLYCASGRRSAAARATLLKAGFTDVRDLQGGIRAWAAQGLPVVH